jgi:hypothetical protein
MIGYAIRSSWVCGMIRKRPKLFGRKQTRLDKRFRRLSRTVKPDSMGLIVTPIELFGWTVSGLNGCR